MCSPHSCRILGLPLAGVGQRRQPVAHDRLRRRSAPVAASDRGADGDRCNDAAGRRLLRHRRPAWLRRLDDLRRGVVAVCGGGWPDLRGCGPRLASRGSCRFGSGPPGRGVCERSRGRLPLPVGLLRQPRCCSAPSLSFWLSASGGIEASTPPSRGGCCRPSSPGSPDTRPWDWCWRSAVLIEGGNGRSPKRVNDCARTREGGLLRRLPTREDLPAALTSVRPMPRRVVGDHQRPRPRPRQPRSPRRRLAAQPPSPARWASMTSCARSRASSLVSRWLTWVLTVE